VPKSAGKRLKTKDKRTAKQHTQKEYEYHSTVIKKQALNSG